MFVLTHFAGGVCVLSGRTQYLTQQTEPNQMECRVCKEVKPQEGYAPSVWKHGSRICRVCHSIARIRLRHKSPAHRILDRIRNRRHACNMTIQTVNTVLDAYGGRSAVSGCTTKLTIVRMDNALPLSQSNAIVVTTKEASAAARGFLSDTVRTITVRTIGKTRKFELAGG